MQCKEAQLVFIPHILDDPGVTPAEREGLEAHLAVCPTCADEYRGSEWVVRFIRSLPKDEAKQLFRGADGQYGATEMDCEKAHVWMSVGIKDDQDRPEDERDFTDADRELFDAHLRDCPACRELYERDTLPPDLVPKFTFNPPAGCPLRKNGRPRAPKPPYHYKPKRTIEEGWAELSAKIEAMPQTHQRRRRAR